ncbi:hypothetical protein F3Y22_tig00110210pilonHSYRG00079 [Hibiscus syriacus]|uniref:NAC domain-containing protein n=1 Tax=Hibiscus syriacus TaxID=106335 RepID=A0A6A3BAH4_HIBSY|nr:hypothetical protein F3Y22_tig00110210pilonHSYRG00079 [Hibiscus syriacus]
MATRATSPPANIGFTCTNEELFIGLDKLTSGSPLPSNVIDVNPYRYEPQNLPGDFWFLSSSNDNTDIEHGLWKTKEEAREVFSNSDIFGWRTTLEYYNGQVPCERKTNCTRIGSSRNHQVNKHDETEVLGVAERLLILEHQGENIVEMDFFSGAKIDFFSGGDFLELKDLENAASSSSSENSSAVSISSDECFDSMAFLQDLDQDQVFERNDTVKKPNVSASNRLDEGVIVPATLGTLVSIPGSNSGSEEFFKTTGFMSNSSCGSRNLNNKVTKCAKGNRRVEGPSSSQSSSSGESLSPSDSFMATAGRRKRDGFGRMKELRKKYCCFMPF